MPPPNRSPISRATCWPGRSSVAQVRRDGRGHGGDPRSRPRRRSRVIRGLGASTQEIGGILDVIDDVGDQTSLLALNAAIIAAQAGEHGRAFSVVAEEIRDLADRVLVSTKEIGGLIRAVQSESEHAIGAIEAGSSSVQKGVELSVEAGRALDGITEVARETGDPDRGRSSPPCVRRPATLERVEAARRSRRGGRRARSRGAATIATASCDGALRGVRSLRGAGGADAHRNPRPGGPVSRESRASSAPPTTPPWRLGTSLEDPVQGLPRARARRRASAAERLQSLRAVGRRARPRAIEPFESRPTACVRIVGAGRAVQSARSGPRGSSDGRTIMIAACPKCSARYRVDAARLGPEGAKLRCTKCSALFLVRVPNAPAPQTRFGDALQRADRSCTRCRRRCPTPADSSCSCSSPIPTRRAARRRSTRSGASASPRSSFTMASRRCSRSSACCRRSSSSMRRSRACTASRSARS